MVRKDYQLAGRYGLCMVIVDCGILLIGTVHKHNFEFALAFHKLN